MQALSGKLAAMRLFIVMLLMTVGLHAVAGHSADLAPERGSAFSVGTSEVAILTLRQEGVPQAKFTPPTSLPPAEPVIQVVPAALAMPESPAKKPASTGPPSREWNAFALSPRAPPSA